MTLPADIAQTLEVFLGDPTKRLLILPPTLETHQRHLVHRRCSEVDPHLTHETRDGQLWIERHLPIPRPPGTDLRFKLIRGFLFHEKLFSRFAHQNAKRIGAARVAVALSLDIGLDGNPKLDWDPILNVDDAMNIYGMIFIPPDFLTKIDGMRNIPENPPNKGKFCCAGPALLLGLFDAVLHENHGEIKNYQDVKILATELVEYAQKYSEEPIEEASSADPGFNKVSVLVHTAFVSLRKKNKKDAFSLTKKGLAAARAMRLKFLIQPAPKKERKEMERQEKVESHLPLEERENPKDDGILDLTKNGSTSLDPHFGSNRFDPIEILDDPFYSTDRGSDGLILEVGTCHLDDGAEINQGLDNLIPLGIVAKMRQLQIGSYHWLQRLDGKEFIFPVLILRRKLEQLTKEGEITEAKKEIQRFLNCKKTMNFRSLIFLMEGEQEIDLTSNLGQFLVNLEKDGIKIVKTLNFEKTIDILVSIATWLKAASNLQNCDFLRKDFENFLVESESKQNFEMVEIWNEEINLAMEDHRNQFLLNIWWNSSNPKQRDWTSKLEEYQWPPESQDADTPPLKRSSELESDTFRDKPSKVARLEDQDNEEDVQSRDSSETVEENPPKEDLEEEAIPEGACDLEEEQAESQGLNWGANLHTIKAENITIPEPLTPPDL